MLTATPVLLLQPFFDFPGSSALTVAALSALTLFAAGGAVLFFWRARDVEAPDDERRGMAMRPVPTEETELELAERDTETPSDHVARQRLERLTEATRDNRT